MANWIERGKRRVFEKKTGGNESVNRRNHFEIFQISREKSSRHVDEGKMDRDNFKDNYFRNSNFACNVRFFFFFLKIWIVAKTREKFRIREKKLFDNKLNIEKFIPFPDFIFPFKIE